MVILDAATGAVRAMVGGRDYRGSPFNRAVDGAAAARLGVQAVHLAELRWKRGMTPDATVLDAPIHIGHWSPGNFERRYLGEVTLEEALAQSINTAAVRLLLQSGGAEGGGGDRGPAGDRRQAAERRVAGAGHRRGRAAGTDRRLRAVLQRRLSRHAVRTGSHAAAHRRSR